MEKWGIDMSNQEAQWKECDKDGSGMILFDEFCEWAIKKNLDLDDDDDVDDTKINLQHLKNEKFKATSPTKAPQL